MSARGAHSGQRLEYTDMSSPLAECYVVAAVPAPLGHDVPVATQDGRRQACERDRRPRDFVRRPLRAHGAVEPGH